MKTARDWKDYYIAERQSLGRAGLERLLQRAPRANWPTHGALIFPHTRLVDSGELIAAAALAAVRSRRDTIVMLGVLHGARAQDRERVQRAKSGDADCLRQFRRVHGPGVADDQQLWTDEFSLDSFTELVAVAADMEGIPSPRLIARYPFLVGENPADLPGLSELTSLIQSGAGLVATADPVHYGVEYGTDSTLARTSPEAFAFATQSIETEFAHLARGDFKRFLEHCAAARSDFRYSGPVLAHLLGCPRALQITIRELRLVDYTDTQPSWVAGALTEVVCT